MCDASYMEGRALTGHAGGGTGGERAFPFYCKISHCKHIYGETYRDTAGQRLAHSRGAVLVLDGAQAAGGMELDLHSIGCDAYTVSAHKWALAPTGTGVLYIASEMQPKVQAAFVRSGFSVYSASSGTRSAQAISGLGHSLSCVLPAHLSIC